MRRKLLLLLGMIASLLVTASAQQTANAAPVDQQTVQALLDRIDKLEARVKQLEARLPAEENAEQTSTTEPAATTTQTDTPMSERMDVGETLLKIRGFGDVNYRGDTQQGHQSNSFALGQLNLFVTSDISERFKFVGEIVFEGGPDNVYGKLQGERNKVGVDVERLLLQYSYKDYFNLEAGRYHTAIGYYNTAYHHSTWFQTTQGRPFIFEFEDRGGILPIHNVGISANGQIPSSSLGLHYVAEVGNGRSSRSTLDEQVQNVIDENNHKAFNLALFARPHAVPGLQAGFSAYHDVLQPLGLPKIGETILAAHAVLIRPKFEWLNEALVVRHSVSGSSHVFETPGFYTQISRQWGAYRPYFRYQYVNASNNEPIFPDIQLRHGPSVGMRYDVSEFVALKLQYDHTGLRQQPGVNSLGLQVGFTF